MVTFRSIPYMRAAIQGSRTFFFDFEAESTEYKKNGDIDPQGAKNPWTARPTLLSLATRDKVGVYSITPEITGFFRELCGNPEYTAVAHNTRYDCILGHQSGVLPFDQFRAHLLDSRTLCWGFNEEESHGLKYLVDKYCGHKMVSYKEATQDNPIAKRLARVRSVLKNIEATRDQWRGFTKSARRPFPRLDEPPITWNRIRKILIESGKLGSQFDTPKARGCLLEIRDYLFSEEQRNEWEEHARARERVLRAQIPDLERQLDHMFRTYAADDTLQLVKLSRVAYKKLVKEGTWNWFNTVEASVGKAYIEAEIHGLPVDLPALREREVILRPIVADLADKVYALAGSWDFNIGSPSDVPRVMFSDLGVDPPMFKRVPCPHMPGGLWYRPKMNAEGIRYCEENSLFPDTRHPPSIDAFVREKGLSCSKDVLELVPHPIAQAILDWRTASKLESTYLNKYLPLLEASDDNRLRGVFNPVGTDTGRTSSSQPNLQTVPSRGKGGAYDERIQYFGAKLREVFVAPPPDEQFPEGYDLIICDQSQIELRFLAHYSGDLTLNYVYNEHVAVGGVRHYVGDIHATTADKLSIVRSGAKVCNFSLMYGTGDEAFARLNNMLIPGTLDYDVEKAADWKRRYFEEYPGPLAFMNKMKKEWYSGVREYQTVAGRFRHFMGDSVSKGKIVNARIQGSSADLVKVNIWAIREWLYKRFPGLALLFQVHDELGYACPKRYSREVGVLIKYIMEYPFFRLSVPVLAGAKVCSSWADAHDDSVPEVGSQYARIDGHDRLFTAENWDEFCDADDAKAIEAKGACAQLTPDQLRYCATTIPELPLPKGLLVNPDIN